MNGHDLCQACGRHACVCCLNEPVIRDVIGDRNAWKPGGTAAVLTASVLGGLDAITLINISHSTFFRDSGVADMATAEIKRRQELEA